MVTTIPVADAAQFRVADCRAENLYEIGDGDRRELIELVGVDAASTPNTITVRRRPPAD